MFKDYLYYIGFRMREKITEEIELRSKKRSTGHHGRFVFQKAAICAAAILWLVAAGNIVWGKSGYGFLGYLTSSSQKAVEASNGKIVNAFAENEFDSMTAGISAYGKYSDSSASITEAAKELILKKTAEKIGIDRYQINDDIEDGNKVKTLAQSSKNGDVICKFITMDAQEYLYVGIELKNSVDAAFTYEKIVQEIMDGMNIDTTVTVNLQGIAAGQLSSEDRNRIADHMLGQIGAKMVAENREGDPYTIYAYDKKIAQYIMVANEKVNVNISVSYDEQKNETHVYLATPISTQDY